MLVYVRGIKSVQGKMSTFEIRKIVSGNFVLLRIIGDPLYDPNKLFVNTTHFNQRTDGDDNWFKQ